MAVDIAKALVHAGNEADVLCRERLIHDAVRGDGQTPRVPEEEGEEEGEETPVCIRARPQHATAHATAHTTAYSTAYSTA